MAVTKTRETTLEKIQKLLALAERGGTEAEAALAAEQAQKLMIREAITEAELIFHSKKGSETPETREYYFTGEKSTWAAKFRLYEGVARAFGLRAYSYSYKRGVNGTRRYLSGEYIVVGFPSDIETYLLIVNMLELQMVSDFKALEKVYYPWDTDSWAGHTAFTYSFFLGFADRVTARLEESRAVVIEEIKSEGTGQELVLVDRQSQVDDFIAKTIEFARDGATRAPREFDHHSYHSGQESGSRADLGQTRIRESEKKELS